MVNISITVYVNDTDYIKYVSHKKAINQEARTLIKQRISEINKDPEV